MSTRLIDVADNVTGGDSRWTAGLEVETLQCSLASRLTPLCLPAPAQTLSGSAAGTPTGHGISPFDVSVELRQPNMCRTLDPQKVVEKAVEVELDKALGRALWYGTGASEVWLGHASVDVAADLPTALKQFYDTTVGLDPVIHYGIGAAMAAGTNGQMANGRLNALPNVDVVINSGYPSMGIAVTGRVEYWRTGVETIQVHNVGINRETTMAALMAALSFHPCAAIVVGTDTPDQVYLGVFGDTVTLAVT